MFTPYPCFKPLFHFFLYNRYWLSVTFRFVVQFWYKKDCFCTVFDMDIFSKNSLQRYDFFAKLAKENNAFLAFFFTVLYNHNRIIAKKRSFLP